MSRKSQLTPDTGLEKVEIPRHISEIMVEQQAEIDRLLNHMNGVINGAIEGFIRHKYGKQKWKLSDDRKTIVFLTKE